MFSNLSVQPLNSINFLSLFEDSNLLLYDCWAHLKATKWRIIVLNMFWPVSYIFHVWRKSERKRVNFFRHNIELNCEFALHSDKDLSFFKFDYKNRKPPSCESSSLAASHSRKRSDWTKNMKILWYRHGNLQIQPAVLLSSVSTRCSWTGLSLWRRQRERQRET